MNTAHTLDTQLNVFETFDPKLSDNSKNARVLFLANIQPTLQLGVRKQCDKAEFVAMDTMNFWISSMKEAVIDTIKVVDCVIINDAEARQLADEPNIREVIAFPLNQRAQDLMMGAPSLVSPRQLKDVHIQLTPQAREVMQAAASGETTDMNSKATERDQSPDAVG